MASKMALFSSILVLLTGLVVLPVTVEGADCSFNPCDNGGTCVNNGGQYRCLCPDGYTGVVCEVAPTSNYSLCANNPCFNGGFCASQGDHFWCICPPTHTGIVCESLAPSTVSTSTVSTTNTPVATTLPTTGNPVATTASSGHIPHRFCPALPSGFKLGCDPAEVVFVLEYAKVDSQSDSDHELDTLVALIDKWNLGMDATRVAFMTYDLVVRDEFPLNEDAGNLKTIIAGFNKRPHLTADAYLDRVLDYVREGDIFDMPSSRPNVPRIVIANVHQMVAGRANLLSTAAEEFKGACNILYINAIQQDTLNSTLLQQIASQPYGEFIQNFRSYAEMETWAKYAHDPGCDVSSA